MLHGEAFLCIFRSNALSHSEHLCGSGDLTWQVLLGNLLECLVHFIEIERLSVPGGLFLNGELDPHIQTLFGGQLHRSWPAA